MPKPHKQGPAASVQGSTWVRGQASAPCLADYPLAGKPGRPPRHEGDAGVVVRLEEEGHELRAMMKGDLGQPRRLVPLWGPTQPMVWQP